MTFELLTRRGCHLCEEMAAVLESELPRHGASFTPVDVDLDAALRERFGDVVPVLRRDGVPVAKVRITAAEIARLVRRRR